MKWINIEKATKLEFNLPVFTKDKNGVFGLGKLKKKEETDNGLEWTFQMADFDDEGRLSTIVTHVAIPK